MSNKYKKSVAKRLKKLSHEMIFVSGLLEKLSPENAAQLEGAGLMVSEWAEDVLIKE